MRPLCLLAVLIAAGVPVHAQPDRAPYRERRAALAKALDDGVVALVGRTALEYDDPHAAFTQQPDFYYLTGWEEPGAVLLLDAGREVLFLPKRNARRERYTGRKLGPEDADAPAATGFAAVLPGERFEAELTAELQKYSKIYALEGGAARLKPLAPLREVANAGPEITRLRMKKSAAEVAAIQRALDVSMEAHRAAWKRAAPGLFEYQLAATMVGLFLERGCEGSAYPPIVASGPNAVILHYEKNQRRMDRGELLLMDVAASCGRYAADITRTLPVGAAFTKRQREIYDVVLGAEKAAIAAVKPGVTLAELTRVAREYMDQHGQLGKYLLHGVTHHLGLEVHDAADAAAPLGEGMVITIEPGIYIAEENLGVRIEDVVLVTRDGSQLLTAALPREAGEIEKAIAR